MHHPLLLSSMFSRRSDVLTYILLLSVILGSFSNYLVTKSSVPVMVARKRLRKQSKYKKMALTQVNNINNPTARSLANAKIDI